MAHDPRLLVAYRRREAGWLDRHDERAAPSLASLRALAPDGRVVLTGGEPTLRPDLLAVLDAMPGPVTLTTDGQALTRAARLAPLLERGVDRLRVQLHSVRADAHDHLAGRQGALKRAVTALRVARPLLATEVEITVCRSNLPYLDETVQAAAGLGASRVRLRRVRRQGPAAGRFVAVSPRLGLAEPFLEQAIESAWRAGLAVEVEGFPACALGRGAPALDASEALLGWPEPGSATRCGRCRACPGVATDYVSAFGESELWSEDDTFPVEVPVSPQEPTTPPPPRAGRHPATRLRVVRRQAARATLAGDPLAGEAVVPGDPVVALHLPGHTTRVLRVELVRLAQHGLGPLVLDEAFGHEAWLAIVREAVLLGFDVTVRGTLVSPVSDEALRHLKRVRIELHQHGPDAAAHDQAAGEGSWLASRALHEALPEQVTLLHR